MALSDDIRAEYIKRLTQPESASNSQGAVKNRSLAELKEALDDALADEASASTGVGFKITQMVPPGAV